jgi:hypothetical protein
MGERYHTLLTSLLFNLLRFPVYRSLLALLRMERMAAGLPLQLEEQEFVDGFLGFIKLSPVR